MKYYAIRQINGKRVCRILTSWDECKRLVNGVRSEYKSFTNRGDAVVYLAGYIEEEDEREVLANKENNIYYVDGSYKNETIGWAYVLVNANNQVTSEYGSIAPTAYTNRNITGELHATMHAVLDAIRRGLEDIYIIHDYQGISSHITGAWKATPGESQQYTDWMKDKIDNNLNIKFIKVKGHTGNKWNEVVDYLAQLATNED